MTTGSTTVIVDGNIFTVISPIIHDWMALLYTVHTTDMIFA